MSLVLAFAAALLKKLTSNIQTLGFINRPAFVLVGISESSPEHREKLHALLKPIVAKLSKSDVKGSQLLAQACCCWLLVHSNI